MRLGSREGLGEAGWPGRRWRAGAGGMEEEGLVQRAELLRPRWGPPAGAEPRPGPELVGANLNVQPFPAPPALFTLGDKLCGWAVESPTPLSQPALRVARKWEPVNSAWRCLC